MQFCWVSYHLRFGALVNVGVEVIQQTDEERLNVQQTWVHQAV